jgi:septal ring factor EnvC (AmiA/AmiB activator)
MKERVKRFLIIENIRLIKRIVKYEMLVKELRKEIKDLKCSLENVKDLNFYISSNNDYLVEQRKKTNKRIRQLKIEIEELRKGKKNERKN